MTEGRSEAPRLSPRLRKIAEFAGNGLRLADVGTDHAFVPIALIKAGRIPAAYALDLREGPLKRAEEHLSEFGVQGRVELRLSDGLSAMQPGEAESVLIAGMGGELMIRILKDAFQRDRAFRRTTFFGTVREWIFSPHTEWEEFRRFLLETDLRITREELVCEDRKFYLIMKAVPGDAAMPYREAGRAGFSMDSALRFGPLMLLSRDPVLFSFLLREREKTERIERRLAQSTAESAAEDRRAELREYIDKISKLITMFSNSGIIVDDPLPAPEPAIRASQTQ